MDIEEIIGKERHWVRTLEQLIEKGSERHQQAQTPEERAKVNEALCLIYKSYESACEQLETFPLVTDPLSEPLEEEDPKPWLLNAVYDLYMRGGIKL